MNFLRILFCSARCLLGNSATKEGHGAGKAGIVSGILTLLVLVEPSIFIKNCHKECEKFGKCAFSCNIFSVPILDMYN